MSLPLAGIARRSYVGGVLTNNRNKLPCWVIKPRACSPGDGVDIVRYLLILR